MWPDIWLNEGFARFSEWMYTERTGGQSAQASFNTAYATPATSSIWTIAPRGDPRAQTSFFAEAHGLHTRRG